MRWMCAATVLLVLASRAPASETASLADPWQSGYAGADATGPQVIGLWKFDAPAETADASGHGLACRLEGATLQPRGRFGGALQSAPGYPVVDKPHRAVVKNDPRLTPSGPFTLEMWIQPTKELRDDYPEAMLLDKKYVAHDDYQWVLGRADRAGSRALRVSLGFGDSSSTWYARAHAFQPGTWYHLAFTYDGQGGGAFYVNGLPLGSARIPARKQISPGTHALSIGDRVGSLFHGFPGLIDEVRISNGVREFRPARIGRIADRSCFARMENDVVLRFVVTNLQRVPLSGAALHLELEGAAARQFPLPELASGQSTAIDYPLDTRLRPDAYRLDARLTAAKPQPLECLETFDLRIVPRPLPDRFPVLMWGGYGPSTDEFARLKRIGFTHVLGVDADYGRIWKAGKPVAADSAEHVAQTNRALDEAFAQGLSLVASLSPAASLRDRPEFRRVDRQGKADAKRPDICGLFPEIQTFCYNVGASVIQTYGRFPALDAALIHTEVRDDAAPCFHPHDAEAYRKATGQTIPPEVAGKTGVHYSKLAGFPADRIVPDDHPLLSYYRWYWKQGDGWNALNTAVHRGLKSTGRHDLWTFHDPAVRVASVYGSGGEVDVISQWTYSYPDPIRIGLATDELLAMAAGAGRPQQVMKMTQIIWYRSQTAPEPKPGEAPLPFQALWERQQPDAPFITIAPMHLREAFWTKIARPIRGIMYHGWQSLVPDDTPSGYRFTHGQTQYELERLIREVIRPLGPTLLRVPGVKSDVAFLESFSSSMLARRGTYGWGGGWLGDAYHVMLYAHLQPEIVYDETIAARALDGFRVLVMCDCDVLTQSVARRVREFQARGGIVVADDRLAPAIKPDIVLAPYARTGRADRDRAALVALAAQLRSQLDPKLARRADSSNPDVIPYLRRYRNADYVFLVNDRREYGEYVGQHGVVMENGLPSRTTLTVRRSAGVIYDLVEHRPLATRSENGALAADLELGPCDGRALLVCDRPIRGLRVGAPDSAARGGRVECLIEVLDDQNKPLAAVVPVEIDIRDGDGRLAEYSGSYAAVDGQLRLALDIAPNDTPGTWLIGARELASGSRAVHAFRVPLAKDWPPVPRPVSKELANPVQPKG